MKIKVLNPKMYTAHNKNNQEKEYMKRINLSQNKTSPTSKMQPLPKISYVSY